MFSASLLVQILILGIAIQQVVLAQEEGPKCEIDTKGRFRAITISCNCQALGGDSCEVTLGSGTPPTITCKSSASQQCKTAVSGLTNLPDPCKIAQVSANNC